MAARWRFVFSRRPREKNRPLSFFFFFDDDDDESPPHTPFFFFSSPAKNQKNQLQVKHDENEHRTGVARARKDNEPLSWNDFLTL